jgi:hypothetical protein
MAIQHKNRFEQEMQNKFSDLSLNWDSNSMFTQEVGDPVRLDSLQFILVTPLLLTNHLS